MAGRKAWIVMLDVCLLGTGGMMPLPYRWLTSLIMRYNGKSILIDCGEGTQIALKEKGWSPKPIDVICFTHYHADHISGLPGMLLTMGNAERTEPLLLIGPKGLTKVVNALRIIAPGLPFPIEYRELEGTEETISFDGFYIKAFKVNHNVVCYGYSLVIERAGRFDKDRALEQHIPVKLWSRLQKGDTIEQDGIVYTPDMVLGDSRKGLKVTYCTDTRPTELITVNAKDSDLLILEGMYGEPDKAAKAKENKHMTMYEAAKIAKDAGVPKMWLTHYSPSLNKPEMYMDDVRKIFPDTIAARDGRSIELNFED
jgi:ribonuclease Z